MTSASQSIAAAIGPARRPPRFAQRLPQGLLATAALLAVLSMAMAAASLLLAPQLQTLPAAALLCALCALALLRGSRMVELALGRARGLMDEATSLYNHRGFAEHGGELLCAARAAGRPLAVVLLDFDDMIEVREIYGREVSRKLLARVVRKLETVAGGRGMVARMERARFALVLPGLSREGAQAALQRALGRPCRVEFDTGDSEIVLVPQVAAETAAADVETLPELYAELLHGVLEARASELRREHHLRRERERHSRPMGLPGLDGRSPVAVPVRAADPTLPAELPQAF